MISTHTIVNDLVKMKLELEEIQRLIGKECVTEPKTDINNFGEEDKSHISHDFIASCFDDLCSGIARYLERLHFSGEKPSNNNVRMTKRENKLEIMVSNRWIEMNASDVYKKMIDDAIIVFTRFDIRFLKHPLLALNKINNKEYRRINIIPRLKALLLSNATSRLE